MTPYLNNGYDVLNYFAKFEKFLPHSIILKGFMTVGSQMPELDQGEGVCPSPYNLSSQNMPYKPGLTYFPVFVVLYLKVNENIDQVHKNAFFH